MIRSYSMLRRSDFTGEPRQPSIPFGGAGGDDLIVGCSRTGGWSLANRGFQGVN